MTLKTVLRRNSKGPSDPNPIAFEELIGIDIHKPAQYMGNELGVTKKDWRSRNIHWVLTYPELYTVGASNLGHIILYSILNTVPGQLCDRAYLPEPDLAKKLREHKIPLFAVDAPVKAPFSCPNKIASNIFSGIAAQLTATNALSRRLD